MSQHKVHLIEFNALRNWSSFPTQETLAQEISQAALAYGEAANVSFGPFSKAEEIRVIRIKDAAYDQIRIMWHGHRAHGRKSPPSIPLKLFVFGGGQSDGHVWVNLEVHPGIDSWDIDLTDDEINELDSDPS